MCRALESYSLSYNPAPLPTQGAHLQRLLDVPEFQRLFLQNGDSPRKTSLNSGNRPTPTLAWLKQERTEALMRAIHLSLVPPLHSKPTPG